MSTTRTAAFVLLMLAVAARAAAPPVNGQDLVRIYFYGFDADLDSDGQPDFWTRTMDARHPHYVRAGLDFAAAHSGKGALKMTAGAAAAEFLSPPIAIETNAAYDVSGFLRTLGLAGEGLRASKAFIEVRLYDSEGAVLARLRGFPEATGTTEWMRVAITDVARRYPQAVSLSVATVLEGLALSGEAFFDSIEIRRRPVAFLRTNRPANLFAYSDRKTVSFEARGLPAGAYSLGLSVRDIEENVLHSVSLEARASAEGILSASYSLPDLPVGPYLLEASLSGGKVSELKHLSRLAVMPDYGPMDTGKNFGISLSQFPMPDDPAFVLTQASGAGWLKVVLGEVATERKAGQLQALSDLRRSGVMPVGVLLPRPQPEAESAAGAEAEASDEAEGPRQQYAWSTTFAEVVNAFAGRIQSWQVGEDDKEYAFANEAVAGALANLKDFISGLAFTAQVGLPHSAGDLADLIDKARPDFVSVEAARFKAALDPEQEDALEPPGAEIWAWLRLSDFSRSDVGPAVSRLAEELADLFSRGANVVFFQDPWLDQGALDNDGNMTPFGLAVCNLTHELADHRYAGTISLPNGTPNAIFTRGAETKVLLWPAGGTNEERIFLGEGLQTVDLYGRRGEAELVRGENIVVLDDSPVILHAVSQAVVKTRQTFRIEPEVMDSVYAMQPLHVSFVNKFDGPIVGELTMKFPQRWDAKPNMFLVRLKPGEELRRRVNVLVPYNALSGPQEIRISLDIGGAGTQKTTIVREIELGSLAFLMDIDIRPAGSTIAVYQKITNSGATTVHLTAFLEGEGLERMEQPPRDLAPGSSATFMYRLPGAPNWGGKTLRATVRDGRTSRFLNREFKLPDIPGEQ